MDWETMKYKSLLTDKIDVVIYKSDLDICGYEFYWHIENNIDFGIVDISSNQGYKTRARAVQAFKLAAKRNGWQNYRIGKVTK